MITKMIEKSKLEWESNPPENLMNWYDVTEYVKTLGDGFRLPTIEELKDAYEKKIQRFPYNVYWSSIVYTNLTCSVDFYNIDIYNRKEYTYYVRCVKDVK